ncbi:MAG: 2-amino-4-hydroxy-6-hydroxymethyldihydropteridine diphosphokinase, partial [Candidatus Omnitrophota bacterium]
GDRKFYVESAIKKIRILPNTKVKKVSSIIETAQQGGPAQGPYLNAVLEIETGLLPYQLLKELQQIEAGLGRVRVVVNGPRTIDLDILVYGDLCMKEEALCIPHPRMLERNFVMLPLKEIAPELVQSLRAKAKKSTRNKVQAVHAKVKTKSVRRKA